MLAVVYIDICFKSTHKYIILVSCYAQFCMVFVLFQADSQISGQRVSLEKNFTEILYQNDLLIKTINQTDL